MKKEQLTHTIIYSLLLTACITLAIILTLASCTGAPEAGEPGFPADKTPLTLGNIALAETGQPWTRQTPEEFFVEGDVLNLYANALGAGDNKQTTFTYDPDAPAGNPWTLTGEPLYYEDVAEDYTLYLQFGNTNILYDQSAGTHHADFIVGYPTLDGPTLTCTAMQRQYTQINIVLTKGDDWGDTDFRQYLDDCTFRFTGGGIIPYTTFDAGEQTQTCSVIIPTNNWNGFTLITPAGRTQTLALDEDLDPQAGYAYTITAPYHLRGLLGTPDISITPWQKEGGNTELPGQGPATIAFLDWATKVRAGNPDLDHTLTADIDLTGIQWQLLYDYRGTFDGAGHTITGLTVNSEKAHTALFAYAGTTATIKNLTLDGARIHTTYNTDNDGYLGALVGMNAGIIENCHVLNSSITGGIGATSVLAGYNNRSGTILACTATGCTVQGGYAAGGITGNNFGTLIACHTNGGTVESTATRYDNYSYAAGIAGNVADGTLTACYAAPTAVTAYGQGVITDSQAGGVVGAAVPGTLTANYWKSPIPGVTHGSGSGGGSNTNAEPTPDGLTPEVITVLNAAIDAYNAENANPCQWKWSTEGIIPLD